MEDTANKSFAFCISFTKPDGATQQVLEVSRSDQLFFRGELIGEHPGLGKIFEDLTNKAKAWDTIKDLTFALTKKGL